MPSIIVPDMRLIEPLELVPSPGCPEMYADGAIISEYGEVVRIVLYARTKDSARVEQTMSIIMRKSGFDRSLIAAAATFLPGLAAN